ncbi:MAG: hypothetical protein JNK23_18060 [Opitutaceae bacterium]|nr:hypothetical protein [Opitutaceae bacterium]
MNLVIRPARLLIFLVALFAAAHAAPDPGTLAGTVVVPDGLKAADVQKAIVVGTSARGWALKAKENGRIVLFLEQGGWRSTMTLIYDTKEVKIFSDSGKPDKNGVIKKPAIPESWVKYMKQDITKQLGLLAFDK